MNFSKKTLNDDLDSMDCGQAEYDDIAALVEKWKTEEAIDSISDRFISLHLMSQSLQLMFLRKMMTRCLEILKI